MDSPFVSPAKARRAALQAKDWAYVNSWLARQFGSSQRVPPFERNDDTLRALLALAAANEAADDEAALLHRAHEEVLRQHQAETAGEAGRAPLRSALLDDLEASLDDQARRDLDDLAETAVLLGYSSSSSSSGIAQMTAPLGCALLELTREECAARSQMDRASTLLGYLEDELAALQRQLRDLTSSSSSSSSSSNSSSSTAAAPGAAYTIPSNLPAQTAEWARASKLLAAKISEYQAQVPGLERSQAAAGPTIGQVVAVEEQVMQLRETVKRLEKKLAAFHGLPPDVPAARAEYRRLELELASLRRERDALLDGCR